MALLLVFILGIIVCLLILKWMGVFDDSTPPPPSRTSQQIVRNTATNIQVMQRLQQEATARAAYSAQSRVIIATQVKQVFDQIERQLPPLYSSHQAAYEQRCQVFIESMRKLAQFYETVGPPGIRPKLADGLCYLDPKDMVYLRTMSFYSQEARIRQKSLTFGR